MSPDRIASFALLAGFLTLVVPGWPKMPLAFGCIVGSGWAAGAYLPQYPGTSGLVGALVAAGVLFFGHLLLIAPARAKKQFGPALEQISDGDELKEPV